MRKRITMPRNEVIEQIVGTLLENVSRAELAEFFYEQHIEKFKSYDADVIIETAKYIGIVDEDARLKLI